MYHLRHVKLGTYFGAVIKELRDIHVSQHPHGFQQKLTL